MVVSMEVDSLLHLLQDIENTYEKIELKTTIKMSIFGNNSEHYLQSLMLSFRLYCSKRQFSGSIELQKIKEKVFNNTIVVVLFQLSFNSVNTVQIFYEIIYNETT